ncbi:MAG: hypothetical protein KC800_03335 [Candidatus Eremiobacteraeota bacterium]|nr:hypothetical protein [Candidatus Eremiobacteraeota bacterium]
MTILSDLEQLQETHPSLRQKLGTASTLEDLIKDGDRILGEAAILDHQD